MAGKALTAASLLQCPHGGRVQIVSSYPTVGAAESPVATIADLFLIVGCQFMLVPPIASPCFKVKWMVFNTVPTVNGQPTLDEGSIGLCLNAMELPQGTVIIQQTQSVLARQ